jgi:hypothetical protein
VKIKYLGGNCPWCGEQVTENSERCLRFRCGTGGGFDGRDVVVSHQSAICSRLATAERDAARYRWLRDKATGHELVQAKAAIAAGVLDAAIDSMMAAEPHREEA